jgi:anti-sigma B factor antagonist
VDLSVTAQTADGVAVLRVDGDVDLVSGPQLAREIKQAITDDDVREVVVSLAGTRFLDSSGISVLLAGRREAEEHGVGYRVESATGIVLEVLTMTGVWGELSRGQGS